MSLPSPYKTSTEYLRDCFCFLKTHQWIYNYSNTHILVNKIFSNFLPEWVYYFENLTNCELNKLPLNDVKENCPDGLKHLLKTIERLKPQDELKLYESNYRVSHNSGLSNKKLHEILCLAPYIDEVCKENGLNFIIDIGAGLGYLSHLLNDGYDYPVLGIECSSKYVKLAYKNQEKYYPQSKNQVVFNEHYIDANSSETISELSNERFQGMESKLGCIVGLHACADLSVTILDLFTKLDFVRGLVVMPCCYHRIQLKKADCEKEYFENFPVSNLLKELFEEFDAETFLRTPFLRIACQQTIGTFINMTEEEHERHSRYVMHRAILQCVVEEKGYQVHRLKRKSTKSTISDCDQDFKFYLDNLRNTHRLTSSDDILDIGDAEFMEKMHEKWNEHKGNCALVEILTGLQASIQRVCENLVLLDRVEFLREKGFRCNVRKVTNELLSPRCYALVAFKD